MTEILDRAITIHQPWAWALAAGHKPVENRTWRPPLEMIGRLMGIHASRALPSEFGKSFPEIRARAWDDCARRLVASGVRVMPEYDDLPRGALIGVARLVGVVRRVRTEVLWPGSVFERQVGRGPVFEVLTREQCAKLVPWWRGPWGWLLEEAVLLPEPIPMRGQQGLWRIPAEMFVEILGRPAQRFDPRVWALEQWRKVREATR